jgi:hypothetical protein
MGNISERLFSRVVNTLDWRINLRATVASVLVLIAGGIVTQDQLKSSARDAAYQQILASEQIQDDLGVVKASEVFFTNQPFSGKDRRNQQIMQLYTESLVRWFAQQQSASPDSSAQMYLTRYRQVTNTVKLEDN